MLNFVFKKFMIFCAFIALFGLKLPCCARVQPDFYISAADILQAQAKAPEVKFSRKIAHEISVMERRHFSGTNTYDSDKYRIAKLEEHLLYRTWEFLPLEERMKKLKLASQRRALSGTAMPTVLRRMHLSPKRIANDSTPRNEDNVGILDGLLRLYNRPAYDAYMGHREDMYEKYDYE